MNLAGLPALVLPCGVVEGGLPVGFQMIGAPFDEVNKNLYSVENMLNKSIQGRSCSYVRSWLGINFDIDRIGFG